MYRIVTLSLLLAFATLTSAADELADDKAIANELRELDRRTQLLKQEYLAIERDLLVTAKDLEVPNPTQYTVFLSQTPQLGFAATQLQLRVDGQLVATRNYTAGEAAALNEGGAERVYMANLQPGTHRVQATLSGELNGQPQRNDVELRFSKTNGPKYMELRLISGGNFSVKEWK